MLLELENEFRAEESKGGIKFSFAASKDLKAAVIAHPNHHVFVDEYVLNLYKKDDIWDDERTKTVHKGKNILLPHSLDDLP